MPATRGLTFAFNDEKAAEAAAYLLKLAGGRLPYIVLIKFLYLADRESLLETGFPITGDRMVAMPQGPVLSRVLDHITHGGLRESAWETFVSPPEKWDVTLRREVPAVGELSDFELGVLRSVFERFGHLQKWELVSRMHQLPEFHDPEGSSLPIEVETILRSGRLRDDLTVDESSAWSDEDIGLLAAEALSALEADRVLHFTA